MNSTYLTGNPEELFEQAPPEIKELIVGEQVTNATAILGKSYKIPVSSYVAFENIISYILIGAIEPENAVKAIMDVLKFDQDTAVKLATDLDKTILEKARISILGKSPKDMVTLTFQEGRSPDELRKEILDTTKRDSGLTKKQASVVSPSPLPVPPTQTAPIVSAQPIQAPPLAVAPAVTPAVPAEKKSNITPGSRSALMEQLQVLDDIPNDEEIGERLKKIQAQIAGIDKKDETLLDSNVALEEFMPKSDDLTVIPAKETPAPYSQAPTKYNVDPYREIAEEVGS